MERRGLELADVARAAEIDYNLLYKAANYDPVKYKGSRRLGYENTRAVGKVLGDERGALIASEYDDSDLPQTVVLRPGIIAELYSPGGERIRLSQRLLNVLTAAAEPGEELITVDELPETSEV
jgi:hypothetical protein